MTEKRFRFRRFDVDIADINEIALYEIDNNPSDDLDDSNLFYVYSTTDANVQDIVDKLNSQEERIQELESENRMLKTTISRNEAYINRIKTIGKWSNTGGDVE